MQYQRQGLLQLKNLSVEIVDYLRNCVKDLPQLSLLPETIVYSIGASIINNNSDYRRSALSLGLTHILPDNKDISLIDLNNNSPDLEELKYVLEKLYYKQLTFSKYQTKIIRSNSKHNHAINIIEAIKIPNLLIYNLSGRELEILRDTLRLRRLRDRSSLVNLLLVL